MNDGELNKANSVYFIELEKIEPNPYQPRLDFDQDKLEALADSIKQYGVLQPIVVTRKEEYIEGEGIKTKYQIIAGERRFRASKIAGLSKIPAIIREGKETDSEKLEMAIIENLQREDLNPVDKAKAFKKLAEEFGLTHADIAKKMGKSREYVSNAMRILMLPEHILSGLKKGLISEGHTRSLLMLKDKPEEQEELYKRIINDKLTVRSADSLARSIASDKVRKKVDLDPELKKIEKKMREKLGTKVSIDQKSIGDGGKLTIEFFSKDDLRKILEALDSRDNSGENISNENIDNENDELKLDNIEANVFKDEIDKIDSKVDSKEVIENKTEESSIKNKEIQEEDNESFKPFVLDGEGNQVDLPEEKIEEVETVSNDFKIHDKVIEENNQNTIVESDLENKEEVKKEIEVKNQKEEGLVNENIAVVDNQNDKENPFDEVEKDFLSGDVLTNNEKRDSLIKKISGIKEDEKKEEEIELDPIFGYNPLKIKKNKNNIGESVVEKEMKEVLAKQDVSKKDNQVESDPIKTSTDVLENFVSKGSVDEILENEINNFDEKKETLKTTNSFNNLKIENKKEESVPEIKKPEPKNAFGEEVFNSLKKNDDILKNISSVASQPSEHSDEILKEIQNNLNKIKESGIDNLEENLSNHEIRENKNNLSQQDKVVVDNKVEEKNEFDDLYQAFLKNKKELKEEKNEFNSQAVINDKLDESFELKKDESHSPVSELPEEFLKRKKEIETEEKYLNEDNGSGFDSFIDEGYKDEIGNVEKKTDDISQKYSDLLKNDFVPQVESKTDNLSEENVGGRILEEEVGDVVKDIPQNVENIQEQKEEKKGFFARLFGR